MGFGIKLYHQIRQKTQQLIKKSAAFFSEATFFSSFTNRPIVNTLFSIYQRETAYAHHVLQKCIEGFVSSGLLLIQLLDILVTSLGRMQKWSSLFWRYPNQKKARLIRKISKLQLIRLRTFCYSIINYIQHKWSRLSWFVQESQPQIATELAEIFSWPKLKPKRKFRKKKKEKNKNQLQTKVTSAILWIRNQWTSTWKQQQRVYIAVSLVLTVLIFGSAYGLYNYVFKDLPAVSELVDREQDVSTRILDRNGAVLFRIYEDENRTLVKLNELPAHVVQATIAIEDQDFYDHHGFSIRGITRAAIANYRGEPIQGGSTITQQLVKNRLLTSERTIRRKIREIILAVLVDATYSKETILEMYLNTVAYGGASYGIEEAAQRYFGKPATELTLAEASMLAGLPAAPSIYSPFGPRPEIGYIRQNEVLRRMVEEKFITEQTAAAAQSEILKFRPNRIDIEAAHFVMYVQSLLAEEYGEDVINKEGLEVITSLDLPLQNETQQVVTTEINNLQRLNVSNGAALVTNPNTGEILAMVGSKDYFDTDIDGRVNVTTRPRQPGSSIKPLTYAVALENGKTPRSIISDNPITYNIPGSPPYSPRNYDGRFRGNVTLTQALASSYNIPAVKLMAEVGINAVIDKGEAMGIDTWGDRSRYGLSLTLGGGEVLMTDMAELYGTFANNGYTQELNPILKITNAAGELLYENKCALYNTNCEQRRTLDPRVAYQISEILSSNTARTPAFGPRSVLNIPNQEVAVKTGTTNNLRDNWTIGYTSDRLTAVWVGNNNNTPMSYVASGITGASPIWNNIMRLMLDENDPHQSSRPDGLIQVEICAQTGTLPCRNCPTVTTEYFIPGTEPTRACSPAYFWTAEERARRQAEQNRNQILEGVQF